MTAPLLNEDKIFFIATRLIRTLTGWSMAEKPALNIIQAILFFVPWITAGIVAIFWGVQDRWKVNLVWIGAVFTILSLAVKLKLVRQVSSSWISISLISLLYGLLQVLAINNLFFASFESGNLALQISIYILCWISVCITQFVLLMYNFILNNRGYVPEPNTYYAEQNELDTVTRALYVIIPLSIAGLLGVSDYQ
jgi:hypothetical protein